MDGCLCGCGYKEDQGLCCKRGLWMVIDIGRGDIVLWRTCTLIGCLLSHYIHALVHLWASSPNTWLHVVHAYESM